MPSISRVRVIAMPFIAAVAIAISIVSCGGKDPAHSTSARPQRAILIVIDTLRADHLGCYGYGRPTSRHIDAFAETAALFERAYAQAPWTVSSVTSILSSLYPQTHGLTHASDNRPIPESIDLLPEVLQAEGLRTGAFVANEILIERAGFYEGFDEWDIVVASEDEGARYPDEGARINREAIPFLEENADEPFFLYLQYMDPHDPYDDPAGYHREFDSDYEGSFDGSIGHVFDAMAHRMPWEMKPLDIENMIARYDGEIRYVDERVQEVLDALERLGIADDTVIIITSDHGEQFFEHGALKHGTTIYDEEVRVPLLIRAPGVTRPGSRIANPVALVDMYPTLLDLLGAEQPPADIDGRSLVSLLRGDDFDRGDVFTETAHGWSWKEGVMQYNKIPMSAVVSDRHKQIAVEMQEFLEEFPDAELDAPDQLFDLEKDPGETENLTAREGKLANALRERSAKWRAGTRSRLIPGRSFTREERAVLQDRLKKLGYLPSDPPSPPTDKESDKPSDKESR